MLTLLCISTSDSGKHSSGSGTTARDKKPAHKSPQHRLMSKERERRPFFPLAILRADFSSYTLALLMPRVSNVTMVLLLSHSQSSLELCLLSSQGFPQKFSLMVIFCHFLLELTLGVWVTDIRSCLAVIGYQTPNFLLADSVPWKVAGIKKNQAQVTFKSMSQSSCSPGTQIKASVIAWKVIEMPKSVWEFVLSPLSGLHQGLWFN